MAGTPSTAEEVFAASPVGLAIHRRLLSLLADLEVDVRVTRSEVALRHRVGFAYLWYPGRYIRSEVPAVLSIALPQRIDSPRFKQVVSPTQRTWMHHLELTGSDDLDDEVVGWLRAAYDHAA